MYIPDQEKVEYYIKHNALPGYTISTLASLDTILAEWRSSKEALYHKFGDRYTVSTPIAFTQENDEMFKNNQIIQDYTFLFYLSIKNIVWQGPSDLLATTNLLKGKVPQDIQMTVGNKTYLFPKGEKIMRAISKIVKLLDDPYLTNTFEDFRIAVSQALNQKRLSGNLTISIHPLDYMTMSDNESNWLSCTSWTNDGCYKAGTIEMMNSPSVVVAYLESKKPMAIGPYSWNNKKWRCLFIVEDDFIFAVKSYPYSNATLEKEALRLIAKTVNFPSTNIQSISWEEDGRCLVTSRRKIDYFNTNLMYNDIEDSIKNHYYLTDGDVCPQAWISDYDYNGVITCAICGKEANLFENCLVCNECLTANHFNRCNNCFKILPEQELTAVFSNLYCPCCRDDLVYFDPIEKRYFYKDRSPTKKLYFRDPNTRAILKRITVCQSTYKYLYNNWAQYFNCPQPKKDIYRPCLPLDENTFTPLGSKEIKPYLNNPGPDAWAFNFEQGE